MSLDNESNLGISTTEMQFSDESLSYIENYTGGLRKAYNLREEESVELSEEGLDKIIRDETTRAMQQEGDDADGVRLAVISEGLGATNNQNLLVNLLDALDSNSLLNKEDVDTLAHIVGDINSFRNQGVSDDEIIPGLVSRIGSELDYVSRQELQGVDRSSMKVGLLGLLTGLTLGEPRYHVAEQFMQELDRHHSVQ